MARMSWTERRGRLKLNIVACRVVSCLAVCGVGMWGSKRKEILSKDK